MVPVTTATPTTAKAKTARAKTAKPKAAKKVAKAEPKAAKRKAEARKKAAQPKRAARKRAARRKAVTRNGTPVTTGRRRCIQRRARSDVIRFMVAALLRPPGPGFHGSAPGGADVADRLARAALLGRVRVPLRARGRRTPHSGEVAGHAPPVDLAERRLLHRAALLHQRAARAEPAAARHVARVRRLALQREVQSDAAPADARDRRQQ